jgi:predicted naringenin-chalcone synthase
VEAVKSSMGLNEEDVEDSKFILRNYGNMSSPTILFILSRILNKLRDMPFDKAVKIFACAFGPGISVEMVSLTAVKHQMPVNS